MSNGRTRLDDEAALAAFGTHTGRVAEDLREQIARNRETARVLREHLEARARQGHPERPEVVLQPSPASVRDARAYARRLCDQQGVDSNRRDVLELAVSELVGNAVRHGRPPVSYEIHPDGDDLVLVVGDADRGRPGSGTDCGPDCESGRGLFLIAELARAWGYEPTASGKRVWVRV